MICKLLHKYHNMYYNYSASQIMCAYAKKQLYPKIMTGHELHLQPFHLGYLNNPISNQTDINNNRQTTMSYRLQDVSYHHFEFLQGCLRGQPQIFVGKTNHQPLSWWWLNQPSLKILHSQNEFIFPNFRVKIKKIFELPPPRLMLITHSFQSGCCFFQIPEKKTHIYLIPGGWFFSKRNLIKRKTSWWLNQPT